MGTIEASVDKNVAKMEAQLAAWGARLDELASKTEQAKADGKAEYQKRLEDLRTQCSTAQGRVDEFRRAGSSNWETVRSGIENAWKDLDIAFRQLTR
jgi:predicted  nucleic acid-binding Zn-ribbon protein